MKGIMLRGRMSQILVISLFVYMGHWTPTFAQGLVVSVDGPTSIVGGTTYQYTISWKYNGTPSSAPVGGTCTWNVYGGTNQSSDCGHAYILWPNGGSIVYQYTASGTTYTAVLNVSNSGCNVPGPALSFSIPSSTCSPRPLSYTGTPPAGVVWYWQTSASGTAMTNSSNAVSVDAPGTYYVRPYLVGSSCWGNPVSYQVTTVTDGPPTPTSPTATDAICGSKALMHDNPPAGITWYWQGTNPNGTSTANSGTDLAFATGTYYLRAQNISTGCWSTNSSSISVTINNPPIPTSPTTTTYDCGPQTLSIVGSPPAGVSWYWQGTDLGGVDDTSDAAIASTYTAPATSTYYLRARNSAGCWSNASAAVSVNVHIPPTPPTPGGVLISNVTVTSFTAAWGSSSGYDDYTLDIADNISFFPIATTVTGITGHSYTFSNLIPGGAYYFRVRARKECIYSLSPPVELVPLVPPAPVATAATGIRKNQFTMNWVPSNGATSYFFDLSTTSDFSTYRYENQNSADGGAGFTGDPKRQLVLYTNIDLINNTYYYRVRAANSSGVSVNSNVITVFPIPVAPVATAPSDVSETSFVAHWTSVSNAIEYRVDVSDSWSFSDLLPAYNDVVVNGTTLPITGLSLGHAYYYRVRARSISGTSESSNVIRVVTFNDYNYIVTTDIGQKEVFVEQDVTNAGVTGKAVSYNYLNGLGRLEQMVSRQGSPLQTDLVKPFSYDDFGRQVFQYLPYASTESNGTFKNNALGGNFDGKGDQYQFYQDALAVAHSSEPHAEKVFEHSPLNRVLKQGASGEAWQPNDNPALDHTVQKEYITNKSQEVLLLEYDPVTYKIKPELHYYAPNQLQVNKTTDEEKHEVIDYADNQGRVVLKKVETGMDAGGSKIYVETYYLYDDFGNLVMVLPPEATTRIKTLLSQP
jgi:hypothetical protein